MGLDYSIVLKTDAYLYSHYIKKWCGHCKALAPDWDKLADMYATSPSVSIASVDCTSDDNDELCHQYGVQGCKSLKVLIVLSLR